MSDFPRTHSPFLYISKSENNVINLHNLINTGLQDLTFIALYIFTFFNPFCNILGFFKCVLCLCHPYMDIGIFNSVDDKQDAGLMWRNVSSTLQKNNNQLFIRYYAAISNLAHFCSSQYYKFDLT